MYLLGIDPNAPQWVRDAVLDEMAARGRTAHVESDGVAGGPPHDDVHVRARYDEDGWTLSSPGSLTDLLDELAARCEYAVFDGTLEGEWATLHPAGNAVDSDLLAEPVDRDAFDADALVDRLEATEPWESLESLVERVTGAQESDRAGAIATFTGRVRARDQPDDTPTTHLEFEAYGDVAWERMEGIADEIRSRDGVYDVAMHHRTGVIQDGEDIVFVVILAGHREEAFTAVEDGINRLKAEVPIFKKEVTVDEEYWVHTRP